MKNKMSMKIEYEIIRKEELNDNIRTIFAEALNKQGKVMKYGLDKKADRCKVLCIVKINEDIAGIGAIKEKTKSDFSKEKASVPELSDNFEWELGYFYTDPKYYGKGIATNITRSLIDAYGSGNLMASTEISANPAMVKILEKFGFRLFGNPWKSSIHENYLGLFLKFK